MRSKFRGATISDVFATYQQTADLNMSLFELCFCGGFFLFFLFWKSRVKIIVARHKVCFKQIRFRNTMFPYRCRFLNPSNLNSVFNRCICVFIVSIYVNGDETITIYNNTYIAKFSDGNASLNASDLF